MRLFCLVSSAILLLGLAGCGTKVTELYVTETKRVDQKIEGNRGYLKGTPPPAEDRSNLKRQWMTIDIDLPPTTKEREAMNTKGKYTAETTASQEQIK